MPSSSPLASSKQLSGGLKRLANSKLLYSGATGLWLQNLLNNQKHNRCNHPNRRRIRR
jgi:hypothetical protein